MNLARLYIDPLNFAKDHRLLAYCIDWHSSAFFTAHTNFFPILCPICTDFCRFTFERPRRTTDLALLGPDPRAAAPGPWTWEQAAAGKNHGSLYKTTAFWYFRTQSEDHGPRKTAKVRRIEDRNGRDEDEKDWFFISSESWALTRVRKSSGEYNEQTETGEDADELMMINFIDQDWEVNKKIFSNKLCTFRILSI